VTELRVILVSILASLLAGSFVVLFSRPRTQLDRSRTTRRERDSNERLRLDLLSQ